MTTLSTHVLDSGSGSPAVGVAVDLAVDCTTVASGVTDADGRFRFDVDLAPGDHDLTFFVREYYDGLGVATFYPRATVSFTVEAERAHLHVPLLLSPFAYSTYRGS